MATQEELQEIANQEIEDAKPLFKVVDNVRMELSDDDYAQLKLDRGAAKWDAQQNGYKEARQQAYGSIAEQLDMQYWDSVNGTTTWKDHIAQVKADNPKP